MGFCLKPPMLIYEFKERGCLHVLLNEVCFFVLHACACHNCSDNPLRQRLPKDRWRCRGSKHKGKKETWVKYSNDRKLLYTLAVRQMPRSTLIAIFPSFLHYTRHWHVHTRVCNYLHENHTLVNLGWLTSTYIWMWVGFDLGSTRIHRKRVQCGHTKPKLNRSSTRIQVAVRTCLKAIRNALVNYYDQE